MSKIQYGTIQCITILLFIYTENTTFAQTLAEINQLQGIRGFLLDIDIEGLANAKIKADITAKIESDIKKQLLMSKIEISEKTTNEYYPVLSAGINMYKIPKIPLYAINVTVEVWEFVVLKRS